MTGKLMADASLNPTSLVVVGIASAFALSSVLYIAWSQVDTWIRLWPLQWQWEATLVYQPLSFTRLLNSEPLLWLAIVLRVIVVGMVMFSTFFFPNINQSSFQFLYSFSVFTITTLNIILTKMAFVYQLNGYAFAVWTFAQSIN